MLPSNLNLNIEKTVEYKNKILIRNTGMKIGSNKDWYKAEVSHQKSWSHTALSKFGKVQGRALAASEMYSKKSSGKSVKETDNQHITERFCWKT